MLAISTTPTKISLCSLWHDVMVSGFNHLTRIYNVDELDNISIVDNSIDYNSFIKNKKPIMFDITVNSGSVKIQCNIILNYVYASLFNEVAFAGSAFPFTVLMNELNGNIIIKVHITE